MERRDFPASTAALAALSSTLADGRQARAAKWIEGLPAAADMV
jgi:hypothetical protein